jgi:hypothetical protein
MHGCCYFNETDEPEAIRVGHQHLCASSYHTAKGCGHSWGCYVESLCGDCNETPFFEAIHRLSAGQLRLYLPASQ